MVSLWVGYVLFTLVGISQCDLYFSFILQFNSSRPSDVYIPWWRRRMETFSTFLALCEDNPPVTTGFASQRPVMQSFEVFFDLHLNKRLIKQLKCWWLETQSRSLWCQCNDQQAKPSLVKIMACPLPCYIVNWILETNCSETRIEIFSFKEMPLKMLSAKWQTFCLRLSEFNFDHDSFRLWVSASWEAEH